MGKVSGRNEKRVMHEMCNKPSSGPFGYFGGGIDSSMLGCCWAGLWDVFHFLPVLFVFILLFIFHIIDVLL